MSQLYDSTQHICSKGRPNCRIERRLCGDCIEQLLQCPMFLDSLGDKSAVDVDSQQNFSSDSLDKPVICELCNETYGSNEVCVWCQDFLQSIARGAADGGSACEAHSMQRPQQMRKLVARGCGVGGGAKDVPSITKSLKCLGPPTCQPKLGSLCDNCMENYFPKLEEEDNRNSPENPNPPENVNTNPVYGPRNIDELGPCTPVEIGALRKELLGFFQLFNKGKWKFLKKFPSTTPDVLERLAKSNIPVGFEGHGNNCFTIMGFFLFCFDKQIRERIDTYKFAGFILRYITQEFRSRLFVDRKLIQLFREEAAKVMNGLDDDDFTHRVSCPNDFLARLEASGIVRKGPRVSNDEIADRQASASFVMNEVYRHSSRTSGDGTRCDSLQKAISLLISSKIESGSIVCFQFKEDIFIEEEDVEGKKKKTAKARPSGAGNMDFPNKGVEVGDIDLTLILFTVIELSHYRAIFFLDGKFFHFNSLSPLNEGHHLPVLTVLSTREAIELWRKNAHTAVFKCERSSEGQAQEACAEVSSALPQPPPIYPLESGLDFLPDFFIQGHLVTPPPPPPQQFPCANVAQALPPPPQVPCASGPLVPSPPPPASSAQVAHVSQKPKDKLPMIYGKKWYLKTKAINGEIIAEGEILETGKTKEYTFGNSVFLSRIELEMALRTKYKDLLNQDFN